MPPFLPRKRLRDESPEAGPSKPPPKAQGRGKSVTTVRIFKERKLLILDSFLSKAIVPLHMKHCLSSNSEILKEAMLTPRPFRSLGNLLSSMISMPSLGQKVQQNAVKLSLRA
jgi:hypothetical protein